VSTDEAFGDKRVKSSESYDALKITLNLQTFLFNIAWIPFQAKKSTALACAGTSRRTDSFQFFLQAEISVQQVRVRDLFF
jgi:hypothetical protein